MLQATAVNTLLHVVPRTPIMWNDGRFTYKLKPQEELLLEKLQSGELEEMVEAKNKAYGHGDGQKNVSLERRALTRIYNQQLDRYFGNIS